MCSPLVLTNNYVTVHSMNVDVWKNQKIYKSAGKCDDQHHYKYILESGMVSTPEGCNDNIPIKPNQYEPMKNNSVIKSLRQFSETLDVKHKTYVCRSGAAKEN